jgi:HD-like signal output (HDOD) protein
MFDKSVVAPFSSVLTACETPDVLKKRALGALGELPPFSPILTRLLASLAGNDVSFSGLSDLIEKDTVLAGNLLHLVNSALYGRRGTINSVRHALSILGVNKLRNAILGMSISRMWNSTRMPPGWSMARFNMHSAATATLSDMLAQRLPVEYPEGAFVAGLLHDVGSLLIALKLTEQHDQVQRMTEESHRPPVDCELEVLGFTHPDLSGDALAFWNLPEPIQTAVRYHHSSLADDSKTNPGEIRLSRVLDAADQYVNALGISILPIASPGESDASLIESLGLDPDRLTKALSEFKTEFETMSQFFR